MDDEAMIFNLFKRRQEDPAVAVLHEAVVSQSRQPCFYLDYGVADSVDGRYDMLILHTFLVFRRLSDGGEERRLAAQELCDRIFLDLDRSLREMGVGDLSVPKRMKKLAQKFYGRVEAYDKALLEPDDIALAEALDRNVYRGDGTATPNAMRLASYLRTALKELEHQDIFPQVPRFPGPETIRKVS
ncbi:ubiquinol-cytochrome C chaperone family protein [Agaricicola taiwanensis]|nr:ubiquinol-cytochrome C chaperone family protein [Agaricicola taiwanensis]